MPIRHEPRFPTVAVITIVYLFCRNRCGVLHHDDDRVVLGAMWFASAFHVALWRIACAGVTDLLRAHCRHPSYARGLFQHSRWFCGDFSKEKSMGQNLLQPVFILYEQGYEFFLPSMCPNA